MQGSACFTSESCLFSYAGFVVCNNWWLHTGVGLGYCHYLCFPLSWSAGWSTGPFSKYQLWRIILWLGRIQVNSEKQTASLHSQKWDCCFSLIPRKLTWNLTTPFLFVWYPRFRFFCFASYSSTKQMKYLLALTAGWGFGFFAQTCIGLENGRNNLSCRFKTHYQLTIALLSAESKTTFLSVWHLGTFVEISYLFIQQQWVNWKRYFFCFCFASAYFTKRIRIFFWIIGQKNCWFCIINYSSKKEAELSAFEPTNLNVTQSVGPSLPKKPQDCKEHLVSNWCENNSKSSEKKNSTFSK